MLQGEGAGSLWVVSFARQRPILPYLPVVCKEQTLAAQVPLPQPQESSSQCSPRLPEGGTVEPQSLKMFSPGSPLMLLFCVALGQMFCFSGP